MTQLSFSLFCHVGLHLRSLVLRQRICKVCEGSSVLSQYIFFLGTESINKAQRFFFFIGIQGSLRVLKLRVCAPSLTITVSMYILIFQQTKAFSL